MKNKSLIFFSSLFLIAHLYAQEKPSLTSPQLPEVTIKGGDKKGLEGEKPLLEIEVNSLEPALPALEIEEDLLQKNPEALRDERVGYPKTLSNVRTILPARTRLVKEPVKTFYPLREIVSEISSENLAKGWEMVIADSEGHPFHTFKGKSLPPAKILWTGRNETNQMMEVGKNYSTVLTCKDNRGQSRNLISKPFWFEGILHQEAKGLFISLSPNALFKEKEENTDQFKISELGVDLLKESADWIKRYAFTLPLEVEYYFIKEEPLAQTKAQIISKFLSDQLILPEGRIPIHTHPSQKNSEEIALIIGNR
ncbi:MAG: hypothetical protein HYT97_03940 [Elusimicrobia bacterium]|nr:hypothetical protein [Elusimicrobiota bacterium]